MRLRIVSVMCLMLLLSGVQVFAGGSAEREGTVIGISKFVSHPALDAVEQGIIDDLSARGYTDLRFDRQDSTADVAAARQIASKFQADRVNVAVGIATPNAQALQSAIQGIPVVYTAITDPVSAGLVEAIDQGSPGIAGVTHRTPVKDQIRLLMEIHDIRRLGHVYSSGEANAVYLAEQTEAAARELGIEFISQTITNPSEVRQATQSIIQRVDAIYVSTDNQVVAALSALSEVAMAAGVPVLSADPGSAETNDVLIAWGFDWYGIGRTTGELIHRILQGESPGTIPPILVDDADTMEMILNLDVAERIGISLPQSLIDSAERIIQNGEIIRR
ncbi:MAG: ABC transporter substrate-binding protein [Spirochaetaceae bacterium]|nr:MAG: ABC transporter substrate-binding protein [Spirochaetaceae bacterium]